MGSGAVWCLLRASERAARSEFSLCTFNTGKSCLFSKLQFPLLPKQACSKLMINYYYCIIIFIIIYNNIVIIKFLYYYTISSTMPSTLQGCQWPPPPQPAFQPQLGRGRRERVGP